MFLGFTGTHTPRLDDKGRLFLPAKFRDQFTGGVVLTKGQEGCLRLYPAHEFVRQGELVAADQSTPEARDDVRTFFAGASDQVPDKQGRITVPADLRAYAGLDREVAVLGVHSYMEIWDLPTWQAEEAARDARFKGRGVAR